MNFTDLLTDLASSANAIIRISAARFNLTASQAFHLLLIPFDGIPMSALAHRLGLDNSTLTRNINILIKQNGITLFTENYDENLIIKEYWWYKTIFIESNSALNVSRNFEIEAWI